MKWKLSFTALIILIVLSMVNPIKFHFSGKEVYEIPTHTTYEKAILDSLPKLIKELALEHNCENFILPISEIENKPASLPSLIEDINLALGTYQKWKLIVDEFQKAKMKKRFEKNMSDWGSMLQSSTINNMLKKKQSIAFKIDYSAIAKISKISNSGGNDLQLILIINNERLLSKVFDIRLSFADPSTITKWQFEKKRSENELIELENKNEQGLLLAILFTSLLIILLIFGAILKIIKNKYEKKIKSEISQKLLQFEDFINEGHFVAALELIDTYLKYFPNDFDCKAKRERLLDFSGNDPKKAQIAFVEAKKLQLRISKPINGNYLSSQEKENIKNLLPYHPGLSDNYTKLISYENDDKQKQEFLSELKKVHEFLNEKNLTQANNSLKKMELRYRKFNEILSIRDEIDSLLHKRVQELEEIHQRIFNGDFLTAKKKLDALILENQDYQDAKILASTINNKSLQNGFELIGLKNPMKIKVLNKKEVILGREEEGVDIDIVLNDKHISRPHLKISLCENAVEIEDLDSSGGTYINGDKITNHKLIQQDMVTLAKVIELDFHLCKNKDGKTNGLIINFPEQIYLIMNEEVSFDINKNRLLALNEDFTLTLKNGIPIFSSNIETKILMEGDLLLLKNLEFKITKIIDRRILK